MAQRTRHYNRNMGLKTWKKWTDWPLMVLSVVFLVVYSWEILSRTHIALCETVINVIWVVFVVDYVVSLWLADDRWQWFKHNLFTLLTIALPMLRPLRLLRLLTVLHVLNRTSGMGGARAHHRIRGRRGGNAHVRGRAGRVFRGARGVRIHDHRLRHGVVVGVRDRDHRGIWRLLAGHLPRQDHCGGADVHRHRVDRYCDGHAGLVDRGSVNLETDRREDAREKEVAKEAAQEAIATSANPEIDLLREEVRELTATVAGLRTELERR